MAKLTTKARDKLPGGKFAGPGRSYPVPDASHAKNAKARASEMANKGKLSKGEEAKIDAKANRVLGHKPPNTMSKTKADKGHEYLTKSKHWA